ncbi:MAG: LPS export ABC transporter periplasmic protein LptC [Pseudomonadota bacterium]
MFFTKNKKLNKLKLLLLSIILVTFGTITVVFLKYRQVLDAPGTLLPVIQSHANIAVGKVQQTATRDGVKEWDLEAGSAHYVDADKLAVFQDLSVTFYLKDRQEVYLTANQGTLRTDSNNIDITGNVVVKNDRYTISTEKLHYEHGKHIIFTNVPVKITGGFFDLSAGAMTVDLNTKKAALNGNVVGTFNETIEL